MLEFTIVPLVIWNKINTNTLAVLERLRNICQQNLVTFLRAKLKLLDIQNTSHRRTVYDLINNDDVN